MLAVPPPLRVQLLLRTVSPNDRFPTVRFASSVTVASLVRSMVVKLAIAPMALGTVLGFQLVASPQLPPPLKVQVSAPAFEWPIKQPAVAARRIANALDERPERFRMSPSPMFRAPQSSLATREHARRNRCRK